MENWPYLGSDEIYGLDY